jgi:hypothetical protein
MLDKAPNGKVSDLLSALDKALSAGEVEHAVDLFQTDCYWRDLVLSNYQRRTIHVATMLRLPSVDVIPQQQHQFSLIPSAALVEDFRQVTARCPNSDPESVGSGLSAVAFNDLKRERCLR